MHKKRSVVIFAIIIGVSYNGVSTLFQYHGVGELKIFDHWV